MNIHLINKTGATLASLLTAASLLAFTSAQAGQSQTPDDQNSEHHGLFSSENTKENRGQLSSSDYKFVEAAAHGGNYEVTLGKVAQEKSSNDSVKKFGEQMVTDHTKAGTDLQQIVTAKGAMMPAGLTSSQQREVDRLNTLSGAEFDKAYVAQMVKAHKADLKAFQHASEKVDDAQVKTFAANMIPTIQDHLKMAQDLETGLNPKLSVNY